VPEAQAEVHARTLAHVVSDLAAGQADLLAVKNELSHAIAGTEVRPDTEIQSVGNTLCEELRAVEARLNRRFDKLERALKFQQWTSGLILALVAGLYVQPYFR
jgi:hypothetical protein